MKFYYYIVGGGETITDIVYFVLLEGADGRMWRPGWNIDLESKRE